MKGNYYLGLDVGTNSVGWAVTDEDYNILKFKKKSMWGIRLFESAKTAEERRLKRNNRRRLDRRKQRIDLLQEIFSGEISKLDPSFFIRLNESRLHLEDKSTNFKYPLFIDDKYNDINYYNDYPTIFHLRKALIKSENKEDIRFIYLALHNIIKYRGHFLIEGDLKGAKDFCNIFNLVINSLKDEENLNFEITSTFDFENTLKNRNMAKSLKVKELKTYFEFSSELNKEELKRQKSVVDNFCKFIVGLKGDVSKLFNVEKEELSKPSFSFNDGNFEEEIFANLEQELPEKVYLIEQIKAIYDWNILVDILEKEDYISFAKVNQYEKHKENLKKLKSILYKYLSKADYNKFFNDEDEKGSYTKYVGKLKTKNKKYWVGSKEDAETFYKSLTGILKKLKIEKEDEAVYNELLLESENQTLLPLQRNKDNGVIPYQVHELELIKILENASKHYLFLKEKDQNGYSNYEKILKIFKFRVPYYIGPLSDRHKEDGSNSWLVRKNGRTDKILPWNIEEIVDFEKSNERFIRRMTNKCTYIIGEDVLPKNSLLYSRYMVLNELNNLKIRNNKVSKNLKQDIFNDLFKNKARVTGKILLQYLKVNDKDLDISDLSGFDGDFKTNLKSYMDFKKQVFGDDIEKDSVKHMVEDIIKWITIYGDDKKMLKNVIDSKYPNQISEKQFKAIKSFRYSGWGNFSEKFLTGIEGTDIETGQTFNIITAMWETNNNLMQLLSKNFTFTDEIDSINKDLTGKIDKISYDTIVKDMFLSPENKRAVWQTVQIAEEIKKIMGGQPKKIFVEMARGGEKIKERTKSRKTQLLELYSACEEDLRDWIKEIEERDERDFNSMKLYLYYTQMGKCMYTGESIDLDELLSANSKWDRDHIYPQSKIKDDSINNLVLVDKKYNAKKSNELLTEDIQTKMKSYWYSLLSKGLISKSKYDKLTRKADFTEEELSGFIARQIVETRQSTKAIADIFKNIYDSEVVYVKSLLVSDFRKKPLGYLKSRRVNDYHHAKDAYLNIVVGNVYNEKFTSNPIKWMKKNRNTDYSLNRVYEFDINKNNKKIWEKCYYDEQKKQYVGGTLERIRSIVEKDDILYTEYTYCQKGELFNATIKTKDQEARIPLKAGLDPSKYGGYNNANTSYFALIEFKDKKEERARHLIGVPIYIANMLDNNKNAFIEYCHLKGYEDVKILREKIKKNSLLIVDGYPVRVRGENEVNNQFKRNIQLKLDNKSYEIVRRIEKYLEKNINFSISEEFDGINNEDLNRIYDILLSKMKRFNKEGMADQSKNIETNRLIFIESNDLKGKAKHINEMLTLLRCDNQTSADFTFINGAKGSGSFAVNKNTIGKKNIILINQSVTGLFQNRIKL